MAKNLLKRLIPILAGVAVVGAGASNVVSCTAPQYAAGIDGQRVVVSTDGGHINDNSFNQDAYIGVKKFVQQAYNLNGKNNYVEAGGTDDTSIISGYRLSMLKRANAVVLPGFSHMNTLPSILNDFHKYNINSILVDGVVKDPKVVSLQFNSQISGVMAGFDTSYLFGTTYNKAGDPTSGLKYDVNGDGKIKIGTFAGASNKYGVDNYMWGLLLGMQIYNDVAASHNTADSKDAWAIVQSANTGDGSIESVQANGNADPDWYTNSFALGDATKMGMPAKLIDKGKADVIFPVAGPQIQDVLTYKSKVGRNPYVIGVDVDQEGAYTAYKDRFVTSAIKNIDTAVPEALYRASYDDGTGNTIKDISESGTKPGDPGHVTPYAEKEFDYAKKNNQHWLGKQPDPFVNWSIDYTDYDTPSNIAQNRYLLKQNYIKLYGEDNTEVSANGAMKEINDHFASLGIEAPDYMKGSDIVSFADSLVKKYGDDKWQPYETIVTVNGTKYNCYVDTATGLLMDTKTKQLEEIVTDKDGSQKMKLIIGGNEKPVLGTPGENLNWYTPEATK